MSTQATTRRRKLKSRSPFPNGGNAIPPTKRKKGKKKSSNHAKYKSNDSNDTDKDNAKIIDYQNTKKNNKLRRTKTNHDQDLNAKYKHHANHICLTPLQVLAIFLVVSTIVIFCGIIIWNEYSKRLEMEFQLQKYNHEAEMTKIALERAKIDAELEKLQQNLKLSCVFHDHSVFIRTCVYPEKSNTTKNSSRLNKNMK